jgi:Domain of unknown function (DUF4062)
MENKKPTVFISSTIYDFKDLRSAIKYYLEELGFEVFASDYNDFPKQYLFSVQGEAVRGSEMPVSNRRVCVWSGECSPERCN